MSYDFSSTPSKRKKSENFPDFPDASGSMEVDAIPNTPKLFDFSWSDLHSPHFGSALSSPMISQPNSLPMPTSSDWTPSLKNVSGVPENFSFHDASPFPHRHSNFEKSYEYPLKQTSVFGEDHPTMDDEAEEMLRKSKLAMQKRKERSKNKEKKSPDDQNPTNKTQPKDKNQHQKNFNHPYSNNTNMGFPPVPTTNFSSIAPSSMYVTTSATGNKLSSSSSEDHSKPSNSSKNPKNTHSSGIFSPESIPFSSNSAFHVRNNNSTINTKNIENKIKTENNTEKMKLNENNGFYPSQESETIVRSLSTFSNNFHQNNNVSGSNGLIEGEKGDSQVSIPTSVSDTSTVVESQNLEIIPSSQLSNTSSLSGLIAAAESVDLIPLHLVSHASLEYESETALSPGGRNGSRNSNNGGKKTNSTGRKKSKKDKNSLYENDDDTSYRVASIYTKDTKLKEIEVLPNGKLKSGTNFSQFVQPGKPVTCNCKKSRCLKMYCDCFRLKEYCNEDCKCRECANLAIKEAERLAAISAIVERNPEAFKPRVLNTEDGGSGQTHLTGCHCRKSSCLKKYCECFTASVPCSDRCRCLDCRNTTQLRGQNGNIVTIPINPPKINLSSLSSKSDNIEKDRFSTNGVHLLSSVLKSDPTYQMVSKDVSNSINPLSKSYDSGLNPSKNPINLDIKPPLGNHKTTIDSKFTHDLELYSPSATRYSNVKPEFQNFRDPPGSISSLMSNNSTLAPSSPKSSFSAGGRYGAGGSTAPRSLIGNLDLNSINNVNNNDNFDAMMASPIALLATMCEQREKEEISSEASGKEDS